MKSLRLSLVPLVLAFLLLPACEPAEPPPQEDEGPSPAEQLQEAIRPEVGGLHGAVVAGHPLAAAAGYEVLRQGGTATDAVVTMAGILAVVRPHMNSVGGDAFALFYDAEPGRVDALNGSGRAAAGATPEFFTQQEIERMPGSGALSVTVPGAVAAWADALERHGTLSLAQALEPAIALARDGFMVSETLARDLRGARRLNEGGQEIYMPGGEFVQAGDLLVSSALAGTLESIAGEGPSALYGGSVGAALVAFLQEEGSPMELSDLEAHESTWTEPARVPFREYQVLSMPANSQGMALLQMVGMADALPLEDYGPDSVELLHSLIEFKKLAFADRDRWVADPEVADVPMDRLLDPEYLRDRAGQISERASTGYDHGFGEPLVDERALEEDDSGDTVYLMAVDADGNAVSWIQSIFSSFGSGLVDPATGMVLQNRGAGFTLQEGHPNRIAPGKRPFHTLLPAMVLDGDGGFVMTAGTPGGHGQPQTVAQVIIQTLVYGLSPQAAVEYPRFRSEDGVEVLLEDRMPTAVQDGLAARGHELNLASGWTAPFGNAQVIQRLPSGILRTGADMRREAHSLAW